MPASGEQIALQADVAGLQTGLRELRLQDEQQLEALRRRVSQLESERDIARQDVEGLRHALADAVARQEKTEIHAHTLEVRLREQGEQYQADLQEALIRERRQARRLTLAMALAVAALVLGIAGSLATLRMVQDNARLLAGINQGIGDIQAAIENPRAGMRAVPATPAPPVARPEVLPPAGPDHPRAGAVDATPQQTVADPPPGALALPEPDFVVSGSLPLAGHSFSSRQDVRTFFEENARNPGVVALPGGLQYKVLIPGSGRTPGPADAVVIEYRAFRPDGTELDNSFRETQPSSFVVNEATPGLREALQRMQEGAQWELYIPPALISSGVRKRGRFGFEPLIYTVELLSVVPAQLPGQEP